MRTRKLLLPFLLPLVVLGSCTTARTGPSFPPSARPIPATFPPLSVHGLPSACTGKVYYEASTSLCAAGLTFFLCDGNSYTHYDCTRPGDGWTRETLTQYDRVATGPPACGPASDALSGTVFVEANAAAPGQNAILAYRYCNGSMPALLVGRYLTGGTGGADLNDNGFLDADQQVITNADQTLLFAVNQGSDTIAVFHIGANGVLNAVAGSPFASGGIAPASVGISGNVLIVANKASDGVRALPDAIPSFATFLIQPEGGLVPTGKSHALPAKSSPTQAFVAPGGKLLFGTEETGLLRALQISPDGTLTLAPGSPLTLPDSLFLETDGGRPRIVWPAGLSAHPTQGVLYTGIPNSSSIASLDFTPDGTLSVIGGTVDRNSYLPCWSVVSQDGRRLYVANAGSGNLSVFDIATDARHPKVLQTYTLQGGGNPWGLQLDGTGTILFVTAPRQVHQVPLGQGQFLHGLKLTADGLIDEELAGSPVVLPVAPLTNPLGVAVVAK
ncbi:MAG: beta-propeller fold lactonase family protein [Labilithrix sp.]